MLKVQGREITLDDIQQHAREAAERYPFYQYRTEGFGSYGRESRYIVAMRAYFDSSGKPNDPQTKFLTLVMVHGPEGVWDFFRARWYRILSRFPHLPQNNEGSPFIHAKDRYGKSWFPDVAKACIEELERFSGFLYVSTVSVSLEEWYKQKQPALGEKYPYRLRLAEWMCLRHLFMRVIPLSIPEHKTIQVYFDRGEDFYGLVMNCRQHGRHKTKYPWTARLDVPTERPMDRTPEIQIADLVGWPIADFHGNDHRFQLKAINDFILGDHHRSEATLAF